MNIDNDFQIGKNHLVCQDYSLTGIQDDMAFAIVCDGCSASLDVDIGARLLALAARETIFSHYSDPPHHDQYANATIDLASEVLKLFPTLHQTALDATLLVATIKDNYLQAMMYGDGVFFHRSGDTMKYVYVELTSGAPDYLSYKLNDARRSLYDTMTETDGEAKLVTVDDGEESTMNIFQPFTPVVISTVIKPGDVITLSSDGIGSFRQADNTPIPWTDLIDEFTGYKTTTGIFAKRRLNAFKRKCIKEGITHSDDISVAAIVN